MGSGGATTAATATADDYESESSTPAPFDWHQSDKDRWAEHFDALAAAEESKERADAFDWYQSDEDRLAEFFDALLAAEEPKERGDVAAATTAEDASEAAGEVVAPTAATPRPVSEPMEPDPAPVDPIDRVAEGALPAAAPDAAQQIDPPSKDIPGDAPAATIGLAVATASLLTCLAVFVAVKRRRVLRRQRERDVTTTEGEKRKRRRRRRRRRRSKCSENKGNENAEVIPDIEAQASQDTTIVPTLSDKSNETEASG